jgi:hypothetical protein
MHRLEYTCQPEFNVDKEILKSLMLNCLAPKTSNPQHPTATKETPPKLTVTHDGSPLSVFSTRRIPFLDPQHHLRPAALFKPPKTPLAHTHTHAPESQHTPPKHRHCYPPRSSIAGAHNGPRCHSPLPQRSKSQRSQPTRPAVTRGARATNDSGVRPITAANNPACFTCMGERA